MKEESAQEDFSLRLNTLLIEARLTGLDDSVLKSFRTYLSLIVTWNARINLTAIRNEGSILSRHFLESIACAQAIPAGVKTLLDYGSGAGFPGVPIAICRPELAVTLAESQNKKAAFLREVIRTLGLAAKVHAGRAETLSQRFDCVTMRAVDRMQSAVSQAVQRLAAGGLLMPMTTNAELPLLQDAAAGEFIWKTIPLPLSEDRVIAIGTRA
jgi:16S rRNA (guanine527-N7)-methyltransferase